MDSKLKGYLIKNKINYESFKHPATFRVEESRSHKKDIPGLHCKTLFLKDDKDNFYLVGMPAEKKLNSKHLRKELGIRKLRFATENELKEQINLIPGSVSIFGMIYAKNKNVILIFDKEVWDICMQMVNEDRTLVE